MEGSRGVHGCPLSLSLHNPHPAGAPGPVRCSGSSLPDLHPPPALPRGARGVTPLELFFACRVASLGICVSLCANSGGIQFRVRHTSPQDAGLEAARRTSPGLWGTAASLSQRPGGGGTWPPEDTCFAISGSRQMSPGPSENRDTNLTVPPLKHTASARTCPSDLSVIQSRGQRNCQPQRDAGTPRRKPGGAKVSSRWPRARASPLLWMV